jgi:hypothetical protein
MKKKHYSSYNNDINVVKQQCFQKFQSSSKTRQTVSRITCGFLNQGSPHSGEQEKPVISWENSASIVTDKS